MKILESKKMKTKIAHRTRKEPKKLDLRSLFGKAESSFQKTCLVDCAELFVAVGERSAELLTELQAMQRILRRVTETEIIPVERRRIRRRLNRIINLSKTLGEYSPFDMDGLEQLHWRLETEIASVRAVARSSTKHLRSSRSCGERRLKC